MRTLYKYLLPVSVLLTFIASAVTGQSRDYVLTAPKQVVYGEPYGVTFGLKLNDRMTTTTTVELTLKTVPTDKTSKPVVIDSKTLSFGATESTTGKEVKLSTTYSSSVRQLKYELTLTIDNGVNASKSINNQILPVVYPNGFLMIQTDKGVYSFLQTVRMRVLALDSNLLPLADPINIYIKDPAQNRVQLFRNLQPNTGVVSAEFKLTAEPMLGNWTIKAEKLGTNKIESMANFKVEIVVLPRFEVTYAASPPSSVSKDTRSVAYTVRARYTYGEPVTGRGECIALDGSTGKLLTRQQSDLADGYFRCIFNSAELNLMDASVQKVVVGGKVWEAGTNTDIPVSNSTIIVNSGINMLLLTPDVFDPWTPLYACVQVVDGGGKPLTEDLKLVIEAASSSSNKLGTYEQQLKNGDENGTLVCAQNLMPNVTGFDALIVEARLVNIYNKQIQSTKKTMKIYKADIRKNDDVRFKSPIVSDQSIFITLWDKEKNYPLLTDGDVTAGSVAVFKIIAATLDGKDKFTTFYYQVLSRGRHIIGGQINVASTTRPNNIHQISAYSFDLNITSQMTPHTTLAVYGMTNHGLVVVGTTSFRVSGAFQNIPTMSFNTRRATVKEEVTLTVQAEPNSYVGLVAVDKSTLLLKDSNDITKEKVTSYLDTLNKVKVKEDNGFPGDFFFPYSDELTTLDRFSNAGLMVITNLKVSEKEYPEIFPAIEANFDGPLIVRKTSGTLKDKTPKSVNPTENEVRDFFPETWIWMDSFTNSNGQYRYTSALPDTITSWVTKAFVISPSVGLGIAHNVQVEGFKSFFVTMEKPAQAIRGETFEVKLIVFNYLETSDSVQAEVTLKDTDQYMMWWKNNNDATQPYGEDSDLVGNLQVKRGENAVLKVWIKASVVGKIKFDVTASVSGSSPVVRDIISKTMDIKVEGRTLEFSQSMLVEDGVVAGDSTVNITIDEKLAVSDSTHIVMSRVGDVMGQALTNPDRLLTVPMGCGEQNMLTMVPNIFVLQFMKGIGKANSDLTTKAEANIKLGYQRELTYKHTKSPDPGSFSAFGDSDGAGSTWLTAFVVRSFAQANSMVPNLVDPSIISDALMWLSSKYDANTKNFKETGRVIHTEMQGASSNSPEKLTAYVMMSIAEALREFQTQIPTSHYDKLQNYTNIVKKNLETLYQAGRIDKSRPYTLSLLAYALGLVKSSVTPAIINDLKRLAVTIPGTLEQVCWLCKVDNTKGISQSAKRHGDILPRQHTEAPSAIETTSYALLSYLASGDRTGARPLMRWLNSKRNGLGGYGSTQDTVLALQAMSEFSRGGANGQMNLQISGTYQKKDGITQTKNFPVIDNDDERLVNRKIELPSTTSSVTINAAGLGSAVVTVWWRYNILVEDIDPNIQVIVASNMDNKTNTASVQACVRYQDTEPSGMVIVHANIPTGFATEKEDLEKMQEVKRADISNDNSVDIYLNELTSQQVCLRMKLTKVLEAADFQKSSVQVMRYYQPNVQNTAFYKLNEPYLEPYCQGETCGAGSHMIVITLFIAGLMAAILLKHL